jgi:transposase
MDNLSAHKHAQVQMLIEQTGAQLLYQPPHSPDFNSIAFRQRQSTLYNFLRWVLFYLAGSSSVR